MLAEKDDVEDCKPIEDGVIKGFADDEIWGTDGATADGKEMVNNQTSDWQWNLRAFFILFHTIHGKQQQK